MCVCVCVCVVCVCVCVCVVCVCVCALPGPVTTSLALYLKSHLIGSINTLKYHEYIYEINILRYTVMVYHSKL